MRYILGVDIGTSGTKTVLFDEKGTSIASSTYEYLLLQPQNGWAEQHPQDWWDACISTIRSVLEKSQVTPADVVSIGLSGQMHGLVLLDENNEVLRPAILWCDGRTSVECKEITDIIGAKRLIEITANPALTGFTAGKIRWVQKNEPEIYARCRHILLPKDYIRFQLTGEFATEVSDASGMNLMDIPNRCWSEEILIKLGIDAALMPKMYESCDVTGVVHDEASRTTGLSQGTLVVGGAGDNAAAAVGTGVVSRGKAMTTIGTSGVIFAHMDEVKIDPQGRVHTFCHAVPNTWTVMSCTLAAGQSLKWYRDQFCHAEMDTAKGLGIDSYDLMNQEIERIPIGADRLIYLPYLMGERSPLLDANARGVFFGLSGVHTKYHLMRAVMEGVTYSLRDCFDVFAEMDLHPKEMMACGGGGASPTWRQMMADIYGCEVKTINSKEGPALGVAILAAVGAGIFNSVEEACAQLIQEKSKQQPDEAHSRTYEPYYQLYRSLYPALKPSFAQLAELS